MNKKMQSFPESLNNEIALIPKDTHFREDTVLQELCNLKNMNIPLNKRRAFSEMGPMRNVFLNLDRDDATAF